MWTGQFNVKLSVVLIRSLISVIVGLNYCGVIMMQIMDEGWCLQAKNNEKYEMKFLCCTRCF